jgi:hypothetical protein
MFKQITNLNGDEGYLLFSLVMFMVFFIVVTIVLIKMKKPFIDYMSEMPMEDADKDESIHKPEN